MACRHLTIRFLETGDVEYRFFRHHSHYMLYRYLIEWPAERIQLVGGQCVDDHNSRTSITAGGFLLLEWDKVRETDTGVGRGVDYVKQGYLTHPPNEPALWHYREQFNVKPDFAIWLHSPWERISAIQSRSTASFISVNGSRRSYRPGELSECVFREAGTLSVDWVLETLERPREHS